MNSRMVLNTIGKIVLVEAVLMLFPTLVSIGYGEKAFVSFLVSAALAGLLGLLLSVIFKPINRVIYAKEGFTIVAIAWLLLSVVGALPFYLSREIPSYINALFETVSGFTTTGASILPDVEGLSKGILFWRSFTHWIGGMGVLVFVMAIIPNVSDRSMNILRAEMPGPSVGKLLPRARDTAKILYLIYIALTVLQFALHFFGGMTWFDSLLHAFGTAGTGGFGLKNNSLGGYSAYQQWVVAAFMIVYSINFNLYYLLLIKKFRSAVKSTELWFFFGIVVTSIVAVGANIHNIYDNFSDTTRHASFQVASILSTSGFSTVDYNQWPGLSKSILILLMFIGGCAGSTAGGLKCARVVLLLKSVYREFEKLLHPRSVRAVTMDDKRLDEKTLSGVTSYFAIYIFCILSIFILISSEPFGMETNFTATVACFNNVGPGFGAVGPASGYSGYSDFATVLLSFAMLLGRLEVFPLLLGLNPFNWKKKK